MDARSAGPGDIDAIAQLAARTFALACPPTTPASDIETHIAEQLSPQRFAELMTHAQFFVIDAADGAVSGYAMLAADPPPVPGPWRNPAELRRIYVDEHMHGQGVAEALMSACLEAAERAGHDWVWLATNKHNRRARRFYEKSGFAVVGERTFTVGGSVEHDYVLARRLGNTVEV